MKRTVNRQAIGVALFPFLAVLICTMGALVVLLVLFVGKGRVDAQTIVAAERAATGESAAARQAREAFEDAQWRRELLEQQRSETSEQLVDARARLAHLEEHIARLAARVQELLARAREIDGGKNLQDDQMASGQRELDQLRAEITRKQAELDQARRAAQGREEWYALIPYDGPNGTRRRPIYLECTDRGIVLQPEEIVFRAEDFNGPMGPGNPLDAALRTVREHLLQAGAKAGEPYPLIVVRPSGVIAYGAARSALKSWDDEFGYELVSDDKRLVFGEPDPALAEKLQASVTVARHRQSALVAAMPRKFQEEQPLTSFDPSAAEGYVPDAFTPGGRGVGSGTGGGGTNPAGPAGMASSRDGLPSNVPPAGQPAAEFGAAAGGGDSFEQSPGAGQAPQGPYSPANAANGTGGAGGQTSAPGAQPLATGSPGASARGQSSPPSDGQQGAAGASNQRSQGSSVASGKSRGSNWGIPGAAGRTTGITRSMHIAVLADRVVLVPERGSDRAAQAVALSPQVQIQEVDAFVELVKKEMRSWGLAVAGGYWKPVLQVEVAPDAEAHFANLTRALEGSGYEIQRK